MTRPTLEDKEAELEAGCMSVLGNSIQYQPAGGAWSAKKAYVNFADQEVDTGTGIAIAQAVTVEMLKADVPEKPNGQCRVILGKLPTDLFRPVNVGSDESGNLWVFGVEKTFA